MSNLHSAIPRKPRILRICGFQFVYVLKNFLPFAPRDLFFLVSGMKCTVESSPHPHSLFFVTEILIIFPAYAYVSQLFSLQVFRLKCSMKFDLKF